MYPVEHWVPVPGHEDAYEASSLGRVRSLRCAEGFRRVPRVLRPGLKPSGYLQVTLSAKGQRPLSRLVHQLVAAAFHGRCPVGHEVNHISGHKSDNRPENLEYITHAANLSHALRTGLRVMPSGSNHWRARRRLASLSPTPTS